MFEVAIIKADHKQKTLGKHSKCTKLEQRRHFELK